MHQTFGGIEKEKIILLSDNIAFYEADTFWGLQYPPTTVMSVNYGMDIHPRLTLKK